MKAAVFHGPRDVRVEDFEMPNAGLGDVLIRVRASGICGSDLQAYRRGRILGLGVPHGSGEIMGHEFPLHRAREAYETQLRADESIKVLIKS